MDVDQRLEALEAENERLRDELDHLKDSLGMTYQAPMVMNLTSAEMKILGRLLKGGAVTKEQFMTALYSDRPEEEPELKIIDVFVCKLRKKLEPYGLPIETLWGNGYRMAPDTVAKYQADWGDQP